jgi:hypothetical protein
VATLEKHRLLDLRFSLAMLSVDRLLPLRRHHIRGISGALAELGD